MTSVGASEYHVFASWSGKATGAVATTTELRGGVWFDAKILTPPEPGMRFSDELGLQRASDVTLSIADGPAGVIRAAHIAGNLDGIAVTLELVMRTRLPGVAPTEVTQTQRLTCISSSSTPTEVRMRLADLEAAKLGELYPDGQWVARDWPNLNDRDAGRPVCYPVGTALKLPCPQIRSDPLNPVPEWWFGVCAGTPVSFALTSVTVGLNRLGTALNLSSTLRIGQAVYVAGSTAVDGRYTVTGIAPTYITVAETLVASASAGTLYVMPHPLSVYRSGRVVASSEYAVHWLHNIGTVVNGDWQAGFTGWNQWYYTTVGGYVGTNPGVGSSLTTGVGGLTITSVSNANFAFIQQYGVTTGLMSARKGALYAVQITVAAGASDAVVTSDGPPVMVHRCPAGKTTTVILTAGQVGGSTSFGIGVWNNTGTVTITKVRTLPVDAVLLRFASEQVDFQGNPYAIEADAFGFGSRNVADEISRILTQVGLVPNAASIATAAGVASTAMMFVDCDYGRGGQRRVSAILDDLLFVARAGLSRNATGEYVLWQDVSASVVNTYDESKGDAITVDGCDREGRPSKIGIKYRPSSRDPRELQASLDRTITDGLLGDENPRQLPYVRDFATADRLISYLAARRVANQTARATVYREQRTIGERLTITSPLNWSGAKDWLVRSVTRTPNANTLDLIEYDAAVYTYTIGPDDIAADEGYAPDYSRTPPAAPSAMSVTAGAASLSTDGRTSSRVSVQCTAPAVNWSTVWFAVVHNVTGEIIQQQATMSGATATANIGGLRAGEVYQLKAYAINAFNLQGAILSTFNATAIGGGSLVTTFTAPGYATLPPDVASITVNRGTGALINVNWPAVSMSGDNLAEYILERNYGLGFLEVWRGRSLNYVDRDVGYGTSYTYRVKARNLWGSVSANWRTSSSFLLSRNINGGSSGDIMDTTVQTVNRTAVTTFFVNVPMSGVFRNFTAVAHGMVKTPIACVVGSDVEILGTIHSIDTTNITVRATYFGNGETESATGPGAHVHNLLRAPSPGGMQSVSLVFW